MQPGSEKGPGNGASALPHGRTSFSSRPREAVPMQAWQNDNNRQSLTLPSIAPQQPNHAPSPIHVDDTPSPINDPNPLAPSPPKRDRTKDHHHQPPTTNNNTNITNASSPLRLATFDTNSRRSSSPADVEEALMLENFRKQPPPPPTKMTKASSGSRRPVSAHIRNELAIASASNGPSTTPTPTVPGRTPVQPAASTLIARPPSAGVASPVRNQILLSRSAAVAPPSTAPPAQPSPTTVQPEQPPVTVPSPPSPTDPKPAPVPPNGLRATELSPPPDKGQSPTSGKEEVFVPNSSAHWSPVHEEKHDDKPEIVGDDPERCHFQKQRNVGRGRFGNVWKVTDVNTNDVCAAKLIDTKSLTPAHLGLIREEIACLKQCDHPCILKYRHSAEEVDQMIIVTEFLNAGDLSLQISERRKRQRPFKESEVWLIFAQLSLALHHVHSLNILHRDIKPANILLSTIGVFKLADFGFAKRYNQPVSNEVDAQFCGTPAYCAPEVLKRRPYSSKAEMWSLGALVYELTTLRRAFPGDTNEAVKESIYNGAYAPMPSGYSENLRQTIGALLQQDAAARPSFTDLFQHAPFRQHGLSDLQARVAKLPAEISGPLIKCIRDAIQLGDLAKEPAIPSGTIRTGNVYCRHCGQWMAATLHLLSEELHVTVSLRALVEMQQSTSGDRPLDGSDGSSAAPIPSPAASVSSSQSNRLMSGLGSFSPGNSAVSNARQSFMSSFSRSNSTHVTTQGDHATAHIELMDVDSVEVTVTDASIVLYMADGSQSVFRCKTQPDADEWSSAIRQAIDAME